MDGRDKLLAHLEGQPLLRRMALRALAFGPTFVTLPAADHPRRKVLPAAAVVVLAHEAHLGLSYSLRAGIAALPAAATGVLILPADMPDIETADLHKVADYARRTGAEILRATTQSGQAGHPSYFAASQFPLFERLTGDQGAGPLLRGLQDQTCFVALEGDRARLDLDTPAQWDAYQSRP